MYNHYPLDKYYQKLLAGAFQWIAIYPMDTPSHPEKQLAFIDKASRLEATLLGVISGSEKDSSQTIFDHF